MYRFVENLKSDKTFYFYSGTTALYALLKSMGVKLGDEVIMPVFTCPAVPSPVVRLEATPVYVDIDSNTFNLNPAKLGAKITKKTKAIIIQHTFGIPAEMEPILDLAHKHHLWVIEDTCHALGSKYKGQEVGTFGDAAIYSFGWYKPIELGQGGAAIVNNPLLKTKVQEIFDSFTAPSLTELLTLRLQYAIYSFFYTPTRFWMMKEVYRRLRDFSSGSRRGRIGSLIFGHPEVLIEPSADKEQNSQGTQTEPVVSSLPAQTSQVAMNLSSKPQSAGKKMAVFECKRLFRKLEYVDKMIAHQKEMVSTYQEFLAQIGYPPFQIQSYLEPVYYKYPLLFDRKKDIFKKARQVKLEMSDMFGSPLYPAERAANWKALGYCQGLCPVSEGISDRIVALPVHMKVNAEQIEKTVTFLKSFQ